MIGSKYFGEGAPTIIQGGMGIAVSSWRLARAVAKMGEIGVVSGTCIDTVVVRELQQGDPFNRIPALQHYPDREIVDEIIGQYFVAGGIGPETAFRLLPIHPFKRDIRAQRILSACAFSEVFLARQGHDGIIGINLLCELKRYTLPCLYGAMLAGVDAVFIGAGIPIEEAAQIPKLAAGEPARLRLEVDLSAAPDRDVSHYYDLAPRDLLPEPPQLTPPAFFPIIASELLARILDKKIPKGVISGWIIEGPVAGGHNAPPRNKGQDEAGNPRYDERDIVDLDRVSSLGYPYYLGGGYGTPEKRKEALELGALGVQVGSLFSLANESGYPAESRRHIIEKIHRGEASIRTDGKISATGFPFKVLELEGTLGIPGNNLARTRICDLGYLQTAYVDPRGRLGVRCPSAPVATFVKQGGDPASTEGKGCLCNGLLANIGLGQQQKWGQEKPLFTGGDDLLALPLGSAAEPHFSAADVIRYLREEG
jgi:NAD(P)H-dependent flavin oxidoreductase YrpB (nitropropane dioxygenase family)